MITIKLTAVEARALSTAIKMAMHSDYWTEGAGADQQYAALKRTLTKLKVAKPVPVRKVKAEPKDVAPDEYLAGILKHESVPVETTNPKDRCPYCGGQIAWFQCTSCGRSSSPQSWK